MEVDKYPVFITIQPSCSLLHVNAKELQCKTLLAVNHNFKPLQQNQQPKRFIIAIKGLLIVIFSGCVVVQELHG